MRLTGASSAFVAAYYRDLYDKNGFGGLGLRPGVQDFEASGGV